MRFLWSVLAVALLISASFAAPPKHNKGDSLRQEILACLREKENTGLSIIVLDVEEVSLSPKVVAERCLRRNLSRTTTVYARVRVRSQVGTRLIDVCARWNSARGGYYIYVLDGALHFTLACRVQENSYQY